MPFPITPSQIKALLPTTSGTFCERFKRLLFFPTALDSLVSFMVKEDGYPTDELSTDICALGCVGNGSGDGGTDNPPNVNMPAPTNVVASDDSYDDKIRVTWDTVTPPTGIAAVTVYRVYRSLSTSTDPALATLIATVTAPTATLDDPVDADLVIGTNYRYWVKASNGTETSAFSSGDNGRALAAGETLPAINDLRASYGGFLGSAIGLVWTPPTGASRYDVYRHTANVFDDATLLWEDIVPASTTLLNHPTYNPFFPDAAPLFWDNVGELLLFDGPLTSEAIPQPDDDTDFYYWVVAKKDSPPAVSPESNTALGRINPAAIYNGTTASLLTSQLTTVVPAGRTKMWAVVKGGGGGGAGGNGTYGGGGGGGAATVSEGFTVVPGDTIELVIISGTPVNTGNAPTATDGDDGTVVELKINAVTKIVCNAGNGGLFNAAGGGLGGDGDTGTGTTTPTIYDGKPGLPGVGADGGRSGYRIFGRRLPKGTFLQPSGNFDGDNSDHGGGGSGASAVPVSPTYSEGGYGREGRADLQFGT